MQKLNLLGITVLLICFIHNSHAEDFSNNNSLYVYQNVQTAGINTINKRNSGSLARNQSTPLMANTLSSARPVKHSGSWFSVEPFSESISILLMALGLGLVYLADYRKKKNK